ncbi:MAG: hypothetical protein V3T84_03935 [Phycisphaerales bacterium]
MIAQPMFVYEVRLSDHILDEISFSRLSAADWDLLRAANLPLVDRIFDETKDVETRQAEHDDGARQAERELAQMYFKGDEIEQDYGATACR